MKFFGILLLNAFLSPAFGEFTSTSTAYASNQKGQTQRCEELLRPMRERIAADLALEVRDAPDDRRLSAALLVSGRWFERCFAAAFSMDLEEIQEMTSGEKLLVARGSKKQWMELFQHFQEREDRFGPFSVPELIWAGFSKDGVYPQSSEELRRILEAPGAGAEMIEVAFHISYAAGAQAPRSPAEQMRLVRAGTKKMAVVLRELEERGLVVKSVLDGAGLIVAQAERRTLKTALSRRVEGVDRVEARHGVALIGL